MRAMTLSESSCFFFSSRRRHTISLCDWSSDVCSSDLVSSGYFGALENNRRRQYAVQLRLTLGTGIRLSNNTKRGQSSPIDISKVERRKIIERGRFNAG